MSTLLWILVPLMPLLAAASIWRLPSHAGGWLWLSALPALLLSLHPVPSLTLPLLWPGAQWGVTDTLGQTWLGFSALLWLLASRFASFDLQNDPHARRFWTCWLLALSGNLLLIIAADAASFYIGFTLMSLAAYGLVIHLGGPKPRQAGRIYLQLAVLGEMLLYAGLMLRVHEAGGLLLLADWQQVPLGPLTAGLLLVGFGLKAGFWPLHVWLPLAHPAAPAAASAVLSGVMLKAGILGLWRFMPANDPLLYSWAPTLLIIGLIGALLGVVLGLLQSKSKTVLAYSSVSQMGYMLIILALAWHIPDSRPAMAVLLTLYACHHGLAKGALFMGAGLGAHYRLPLASLILLLIPALALCGLPLTSGGTVKALLKTAFADGPQAGWLGLLSLGSVATSALILRAGWLIRQQQAEYSQSPPPGQWLPWALLCLSPLLLPLLLPDMRQALLASLSSYAIWGSLWPLLLAAGAAVLLIQLGWQLPPRLQRLPNPALLLSLRLKGLTLQPPQPSLAPKPTRNHYRQFERSWNRFWASRTLASSIAVILVLLLTGWLL
ncbi:proton-conducting transporter transmembrane domain-containing protein [Halopseudomonas salegens]|uniref:Formate hydrogenlyase subunit 3/Multisubunit Na+/H+ antiporter, MnhD subunit n=1 Tax=Halopseudomonas salegens TaxID=1434072 RepID=A0A1H2E607_9GAMM|nr:proton-conducting transporter membrane subunit [Halopseudomonas salegens]SDT90541.1 Formate hydrogenlyase subunit 3/Multisubunit Na+/H+ antiporter, MnhD subunit [Halopseudomonas salegens]